MKLQRLFLVTHTLVAAAAVVVTVAAQRFGPETYFAGGVVVLLALCMAASRHLTGRMTAGLELLETVVADHESVKSSATGIEELDASAQRIGKVSSRWETVASRTRQQATEVQAMIGLLDRRDAMAEPSSQHLRDLLAGLGETLRAHHAQIERGSEEIEELTRTISDGAEEQGRWAVKTTTYVEQLSSSIESVSESASSAHSSIDVISQSSTSVLQMVEELIDGIKRAQSESGVCEKKLRALCDPTQQISAIAGTIGDIAARTDLLALNASIESIRAGEHGRGFAVVADEVRKLSEQAADATREISSLIDSMQVVTQESIRTIVRQREQVDSEFDRAVAAEKLLQQLCDTSNHDISRIRQIADSSTRQLEVAQELVQAVEQISEIAKSTRGGAESICWTGKSLAKTSPQLDTTVQRLRSCGNGSIREGGVDVGDAVPVASVAAPTPSVLPAMECEAS